MSIGAIDDFNPDCTEDQEELSADALTLQNLAVYCRLRQTAIRCRLAGEIEKAIRQEEAMQRIYDALPANVKW